MRSLLPKTYYPFFARFRHPSAIQEKAVRPLLDGSSVLLVSATASGKTEAFIAPLVERYYAALRAGQQHLLLVCPTRALVNDAARRLQGPLKACGLELRRRTSDASENPEEQPAALWITTPESFDSLLCRHARWLGNTAAVVLDEIHLLYGTPRGTQALCLLERLDWVCRALNKPLPQRVGATATASQPDFIARSFLGAQACVVEETGRRQLIAHYHEWIDFDNLRDTLADLSKGHKADLPSEATFTCITPVSAGNYGCKPSRRFSVRAVPCSVPPPRWRWEWTWAISTGWCCYILPRTAWVLYNGLGVPGGAVVLPRWWPVFASPASACATSISWSALTPPVCRPARHLPTRAWWCNSRSACFFKIRAKRCRPEPPCNACLKSWLTTGTRKNWRLP